MGSGGGKWMWKKTEEGLSDRLVEGTIKFRGGCGAVCAGMGLDMPAGLMGGWMRNFM